MSVLDTPPPCYVSPEQLCIGLHVHVDLPWTDHPFTFSNFKIKDAAQIAVLRSLGLKRIRYTPAKSDTQPPARPPETAPPAPATAADDAVYLAKRARIERLEAQRARAAGCEREFLSSTKAVRSINLNVFAQPAAAREEAVKLVQRISDSMLVDADVAINLMKEKIAGEDVYFHSLNVTLLSMMMAKELKAPAEAVRVLGVGALFHDVGKFDLPERIARKNDTMSRAELALFQQHCAYGLEIGRRLGLSAEALAVIGQHHEHVDGSGYPKALQGPQVSMLAKIVAIANTFDNLCNPLNPLRALTPHEALSTMYAQRRSQFEATPLNVFVRCMGIYPPGTIVVLSNGAIGMVVSVNSSRPLKPTVMVYDSEVPPEAAILVELEQEPDVTIARTMKPQQLPEALFDYLAPRKRTTYYFDADAGGARRAAG